MERIDSPAGMPGTPADRSRKKIGSKRLKGITFSSLLQQSAATAEASLSDVAGEDGASVEEMLDRIHAVGEEVKENATLARIKEYRDAIRRFMLYVVKHGLAVEERQSGRNVLKQKKFTLIRVIDQKLDRLAGDVLANQLGTLEILGRVDEINGLIVDLVR